MKKIKILYLINNWGVGGISNSVRLIVSKLDSSIFEPYIACFFDSKQNAYPGFDQSRIINLNPNELYRYHPKLIFNLLRLLNYYKFDILEANGPLSGIMGLMAGLITRLPALIYSIHTRESVYSIRTRLFKNYLFRFYNYIFSVSNNVLEDLKKEKIYTDDFLNRIEVLENGVDIDEIDKKLNINSKIVKKKWALPEDSFLLVSAMRFDAGKNPVDLVDTFYKVYQFAQNIHMVLIGDGPERLKVEHRAQQLGVKSNLTITGFIPHSEVIELLSVMDCYISASTLEGLPNSFLEAMTAGLPIVASYYGDAVEDVVIEGETGFLTDTHDTDQMSDRIKRLLKQPELQKRLGYNGRKLVEKNFCISKKVKRREEVYLSLL